MPFDKKQYAKDYRAKNKEKFKQYNQSEKTKKCMRISKWRSRGVISDDYDKLYDYYLSVKFCERCKIELDKDYKTQKCLDHDHASGSFRNILCRACNVVIDLTRCEITGQITSH